MISISTNSARETEQLGRSLAAHLRPGDVLLLRGELGVGKSVLARGIARGLGIVGAVSSPTFTLLNCHNGRLPLHHFDLYRLSDADAFESAGLLDAIDEQSISLIEWPERAEALLPACHLDITLTYAGDETRIISIVPMGGFREVAL